MKEKPKHLILKNRKLVLKEFNLESLGTLRGTEVLVKTHFSGLNFADIHMLKGLYPDAPKRAFVPGYEFSGVILAVGKDVSDFSIGDQVMGGTPFGGFSSHLKVEQMNLFKLPKDYSLAQACALPVSLLTASISLFEMARVHKDDRVLLDAATGALGQMQIAMLKSIGVTKITGLTRGRTDFLKELGVVGMTHLELKSNLELKFDIIINSRGPHIYVKEQRKNLAPLGRVVFLGASDLIEKSILKFISKALSYLFYKKYDLQMLMNENQTLSGVNMLRLFNQSEILRKHFEMGMNLLGDFRPTVHNIYPIEEYQSAYEELALGKTKGKVLLSF